MDDVQRIKALNEQIRSLSEEREKIAAKLQRDCPHEVVIVLWREVGGYENERMFYSADARCPRCGKREESREEFCKPRKNRLANGAKYDISLKRTIWSVLFPAGDVTILDEDMIGKLVKGEVMSGGTVYLPTIFRL